MVEVLGMLDLTLDRVRLGSSAPGASGRAREAPASGYRALSHVVFYLSALSPARDQLAHVLQLLRAPARMGGFALYTQGTCPGTPGGTRVALNE